MPLALCATLLVAQLGCCCVHTQDGSLTSSACHVQALGYIYDKDIVKSLFEEAPKRYGDRNGGYCRVVTETRVRRGDSAEMAVIELV